MVSANNTNLIQEGVGTLYVSRLEFPCFGAGKSLLLLLPLWLTAGFPAAEHGDAFLLAAPCPVLCLASGTLCLCVGVTPGASLLLWGLAALEQLRALGG